MRRIDIRMQELMEEVYVQIENPENSYKKEFATKRQQCLDYYTDTVVYELSSDRIRYWMEEINNVDKKYKKLQKQFKDD